MRIQILELPTIVKGDDVTTPFAVVLDQLPPGTLLDDAGRSRIQAQTGAVGVIGFDKTIEVVR